MGINASIGTERAILDDHTPDIGPISIPPYSKATMYVVKPVVSAPKQRKESINPKKQTVTGVL